MTDLIFPARFGAIELKNRVVMSPLTRNRAGAGNVPSNLLERFRRGGPCQQHDSGRLYMGEEGGYMDYPALLPCTLKRCLSKLASFSG